MIHIKTTEQIEKIREAGKLSAQILRSALEMVDEGVTPLQINDFIDKEITSNGAEPWFKEKSGYPFASCISVNEVWVHGMPDLTPLKYGDIISIDIGVKLNGYYSDHCWTIPVVPKKERPVDIFQPFTSPSLPESVKEFLETGIESLNEAIKTYGVAKRTGDVSHVMQKVVETHKYNVIREYTGHGVGLKPHEDPELTCYGTRGAGNPIKKGMVMAIEIMYCMGKPDIITKDDGWSVVTKDKSLTGMFEHTVALTEKGAEILTI